MHPRHIGEAMLRAGIVGGDERAVRIGLPSYQGNDLRDGLLLLTSAEFQPSCGSGQRATLFVRDGFPS